jgi:hypothetical protein
MVSNREREQLDLTFPPKTNLSDFINHTKRNLASEFLLDLAAYFVESI